MIASLFRCLLEEKGERGRNGKSSFLDITDPDELEGFEQYLNKAADIQTKAASRQSNLEDLSHSQGDRVSDVLKSKAGTIDEQKGGGPSSTPLSSTSSTSSSSDSDKENEQFSVLEHIWETTNHPVVNKISDKKLLKLAEPKISINTLHPSVHPAISPGVSMRKSADPLKTGSSLANLLQGGLYSLYSLGSGNELQGLLF